VGASEISRTERCCPGKWLSFRPLEGGDGAWVEDFLIGIRGGAIWGVFGRFFKNVGIEYAN